MDLPEPDAAEPERPRELSAEPPAPAREAEWSPRPLVWIALVATLLGRVLAPALPGSHSGIARWIVISERAAAFATQLLVLLGTLIGMRLVVVTLRLRTLPLWYRLLATAAGAAVLVLAIGAAALPLQPDVALVLGVSSAATAIGAAVIAARPVAYRAAGLIVGLQGLAALVQLGARLIALRASEQALTNWYQAARGVATLAFLLDVACLGIALAWLSRARPLRATKLIAPLCLIAALLSWAALAGTYFGAPVWQVIAARGLAELTRAPMPFVLPALRYLVEVLALLVAAAIAASRSGSRTLQTSLALALLSRASSDIPALGLLLLLAALLAALGAEHEASLPRPAAS
jgi:hypothetical protein